MGEILLKGGTVIDGAGAPRRQADVLVTGGKIAEVRPGLSTAGETIDVTGLTVTPGIIDPHTHLDGQLMFEPKGTASSWHGITTVLMGHCGYSIAPVSPEHRDYIIHMFARVEEVPPSLFQDALPWDWETFPQYLDSLDRGLGINAVSQVGHSTLRYHVMGPAAIERNATEEEIARMRRVLADSLAAGAFGLTTSRSPSHVAWDGEPVPSRFADPDELVELAAELRTMPTGTMGMVPHGLFAGITEEDKETILRMVEASGGKTFQINGVRSQAAWDFMREAADKGATVYGLAAAQPFYRFFNLHDGTNAFSSMDTWWKIAGMSPEERRRAFESAELRPTLRAEVDAEATMDGKVMRRPRLNWDEIRVYEAATETNRPYEGRSIREIAAEQGKHVADALLDLALAEDLRTKFIYRQASEASWLDKARGAIYNHPSAYPMSSDAGAHVGGESKAGESTYFLRQWVMNTGVMSLEDAISRMTCQAARWIGIPDRGVIEPGKVADIAVFDLNELAALPKEEAYDLPGGHMRWIQRAKGVEHVLVNGVPTIREGKETGELPGRVIRSTWYT